MDPTTRLLLIRLEMTQRQRAVDLGRLAGAVAGPSGAERPRGVSLSPALSIDKEAA